MAIAALECGPKEISDALKLQAQAISLPPVGYEGNYAFPAMQLNVTSTKVADDHAGERQLSNTPHCIKSLTFNVGSDFRQDLGAFGDMHEDKNDCPGGFTSLLSLSKLSPSDRPGYFMLGELAVAVGEWLYTRIAQSLTRGR